MGRAAFLVPILLAFTASATAEKLPELMLAASPAGAPAAAGGAAAAVQAADNGILYAINDWRRLRQGGNYSFSDYARFLNANREWPGESTLRRQAERSMRPGENAALVLGFFQVEKPRTGTGWTRYADALAQSGRGAEAVTAAKEAWASDSLNSADEAAILARYGAQLTPQDHNRRVDALLFAKDPNNAARLLAWTSPDRQAAFNARVAMQQRLPNSETYFRSAQHRIGADAGLLMDRLRYLRDGGNTMMAAQLAAQPHAFTERPADVERWYEMLLLVAGDALSAGQSTLAYNVARQVDDALPQGVQLADQPYGVRDEYTSLTWLAGRTAMDRLRNPGNAVAMFYRYAQGGKSLQVATKGWYWAGRAALASGQAPAAQDYFRRAALSPELFYGQLALERLGLRVPAPGPSAPIAAASATRTAFGQNSLVRATRQMTYSGRADEQTLFVRALAESLDSHEQRALAMEMARQLGRQDLAVWVARAARNDGDAFYVREAFPTLSTTPRTTWALANGIARQESSFDRNAISHAGARGLMQLMPATAREQAGKLGVGYDMSRLHTPDYNIMLGSSYFQRMLNTWDGSVPLAVASYNAGAGNVRKWLNAYGDPRTGQVDMIGWIEAIPFSETRGYVQRVVENAVVYDAMNPQQGTAQATTHVSRFLGKRSPG
ncbi:lytic transglycosylase domain-containing protein [Sphingomonas sabuli]|uniref:Lytic transglycosylase domain-containing protein n=1 Tax=Sphingomonas sabuli TaxID=2764186 RepID=A0A7G9L344_9SPHN|nr:lytic transglycosylase domain-containing protein [Sphingomonas sabuli]QNM83043.1 lytic transglycosylase domain-containing protein [Sphingomonas sabuli]